MKPTIRTEIEAIALELWKNGFDNAKWPPHYNSMVTTPEAVDAIMSKLNELIGEDEVSKARADKLRQSPPWQRNQLRAEMRLRAGL